MAELNRDLDGDNLNVNDTIKSEIDSEGQSDDMNEDSFMAAEDDEDSFRHNSLNDPLELDEDDSVSNGSVDNSNGLSKESGTSPDKIAKMDYCLKAGGRLSYYKIIVDKLPHKCEDCSQLFQDYICFRDHRMKSHHSDPLVYCDQCGIPCGSKQVCEVHEATHHCKMVNWPREKKLEDHPNMQICKYCSVVVKGLRKLRYHMAVEHPHLVEEEFEAKNDPLKYKYKCEICILYYTSKEGLVGHQVKNHGYKRTYKCEFCPETFLSVPKKKNHVHECHFPKKKAIVRKTTPKVTNNVATSLQNCQPKRIQTFKCPASKCNSIYTTSSKLATHKLNCFYLVSPKVIPDIKCEFCGETIKYGRQMNLKAHKCKSEVVNWESCTDGNQSEINNDSVLPKKDCDQDPELKCPEDECGVYCRNKFALEYHRKKIHGYVPPPLMKPKFECKICGATFGCKGKSRYRYLNHLKRAHKKESNAEKKILKKDENEDEGGDWGEELDTEDNNQSQQPEIPESGDSYQCPWCEKIFATKNELYNHENVHGNSRKVSCKFCGHIFSSSLRLERHMHTYCGQKAVSCSICPKVFRGKYLLNEHMNLHSGERPFKCPLCPKSFPRRGNLYAHKRSHSKEKPFKCQLCEKAFVRSQHLREHQITHSTDKPFVCDVCGGVFKRRDQFRIHERSHQEENRNEVFQCKECPKSFSNSHKLRKHLTRAHFGTEANRVIICEICGKTTKNNANMKIHQRIHDTNRTLKRCPKNKNQPTVVNNN